MSNSHDTLQDFKVRAVYRKARANNQIKISKTRLDPSCISDPIRIRLAPDRCADTIARL